MAPSAYALLACAQVAVHSLLPDSAHIAASFQVCSTWVHVVDAVLWPAATPDPSALPDPVRGGSYPAGQQQQLPTAATLWCAHLLIGLSCFATLQSPSAEALRASPRGGPRNLLGLNRLAFFEQPSQFTLPARSLIDLPPLPDLAARCTRTQTLACTQMTCSASPAARSHAGLQRGTGRAI